MEFVPPVWSSATGLGLLVHRRPVVTWPWHRSRVRWLGASLASVAAPRRALSRRRSWGREDGDLPGHRDRRDFLRLLAYTVGTFEWDCIALCLMTTHYHLVLDSTRENLSDGMQVLNGDYAQSFNGKYARWGHVFGDRFWSRSLAEEELETTCLYVLMNPVRAGLCKTMAGWRWSACRFELG
jgi:REP element-mobilizing transposase RayT